MAYIGKQPTLNRTKYTPLSADPSNPTEGDVFYSDGTSRSEGLWVYKDTTWIPVLASSGGLDVYSTEDFEANSASSYTTGNNATFLGAGSIVGVVEDETASPISKRKSLKYTQAVGSLNDYYASPAITLDSKQKDNQSYVTFYYTYAGDKDDIAFNIYDVTNTKDLTNGLVLVNSTTKATRKSATFFIPSTTTSLRFGMQVKVENSGAVLIVDDIEFSTKPITNVTIQEENAFYTQINNNGTATIESQSGLNTNGQNAVASINRTGTGVIAVTFTSNFFSEVPIPIQGMIPSDSIVGEVTYRNLTTSGVDIYTYSTAGSSTDEDFSFGFVRQGDDYKKPNASVVTTLTQGYSEYNAVIDAAATVNSTNVTNWISDANVTISGSNYVIDYSALNLTVPPLIQVTPDTAVAGISAGWRNVTTTSARVDIYDSSGSSITTEGFSFSLKPQNPDFKPADFLGAIPLNDYQTKTLSADTSTSGVVSDLTFNNLVIGRNYEVTLSVFGFASGANVVLGVDILNGVNQVGAFFHDTSNSDSSNTEIGSTYTTKFKAVSSTVTFDLTSTGGSTLRGDGTRAESFVQIEELNFTRETTRF